MEMWHEVLEVGPARSPHRQHSVKTRRKSRSEPTRIQEKEWQMKAPEAEYAWCAVVIVEVLRKQ